jgi:hypothetical protein
MPKKKAVRLKIKRKTVSRKRAGKKTAKAVKKPARRPAVKPVKWYAYCVAKLPPHQYSPIYGYLPWSGPKRATRVLANADAKAHNKNAGHQALVYSVSEQEKPKRKK